MAQDIRNVALTWRQVLASLLMIPALLLGLIFLLLLADEPANGGSVSKAQSGITAAACGSLASVLLFWNHRITNRPDVYPDILARLFGEQSVCEMSTLHFWAAGRQRGSTVRVVILLQN